MNYWLLFLVSMVLGLGTQAWIRAAYRRQSGVPLANGMTGAQIARGILDANGLQMVAIERVPGSLTDHYDPRAKVLRLSEAVFDGRTVAAAGVAAHEAGHAVQHARAFAAAALRQALVPAAQIGSQAAFPLILLGLFINFSGLILLGVALYAAAVLFQIVTLPVEFDASRRALGSLRTVYFLPEDQISGARQVLTAAAMTYLAATLVSVMYLMYYLGLARR